MKIQVEFNEDTMKLLWHITNNLFEIKYAIDKNTEALREVKGGIDNILNNSNSDFSDAIEERLEQDKRTKVPTKIKRNSARTVV